MPLRDHFRPPLWNQSNWEGFHTTWSVVIVQQLGPMLPAKYVAEPGVHVGARFEYDVATQGRYDGPFDFVVDDDEDAGGGVATAVWAPAVPAVAVEVDALDADEYEVKIYDTHRARRLVAAVEIVSPANKDRPESREQFVSKCAALLQQGVSVTVVDLVTTKEFNLYAELLARVGHADATFGDPPPPTYAASLRTRRPRERLRLEAWSRPLVVGSPLPTLPLWLAERRALPLNLDASYEQACRDLRIG